MRYSPVIWGFSCVPCSVLCLAAGCSPGQGAGDSLESRGWDSLEGRVPLDGGPDSNWFEVVQDERPADSVDGPGVDVAPCPYLNCSGVCCGPDEVCFDGGCCSPGCGGLICGGDGCGDSCGSCETGESCVKGTACVAMGLVWLAIPAGTFQMGCSPDDDKCAANELPPHAVTLAPFEMLETEVTEAQYEAVTGVNPSCQEQFTAGPESPVECVPWHLAKEYCEALGGRLPTEAEWEYAARAGTTTRYYCGNDESCLDGIAWHGKNSGDKEHPVKGKAPNAWGLYDMLGNAFEWTSDWLAEDYYSFSPKGNPQGPDTGTMKVVRGGSWSVLQLELMRVSERHHGLGPPAVFTSDHVGFRCVR